MASTDIETRDLITAAQLWEQGVVGRWELVRGKLKAMSPAGSRHGDIAAEINAQLRAFAKSRSLGSILAAETGFIVGRDPDSILAPDVAFIT